MKEVSDPLRAAHADETCRHAFGDDAHGWGALETGPTA